MAARNPDSMTNAQGEFNPHKPRDEPMEKSGHQPGQLVGNDAAPEFHAQQLPAGTAPKSSTFKPNPVDETPGQANNPDASETATAADDFPSATSADVHTGLGHPGSGQTSASIRHDGKPKREREGKGLQGEGGTGMQGEESAEAKSLLRDHVGGPNNAKQHNASFEGAESKESVTAEEVASMGQGSRKKDYDRSTESAPGSHS